MASPRVTAIVIFLDEEDFLAQAAASVLRQSFADWELLLVDDGSSDASPEIARGLARQDARIRYLCHPDRVNRGMSASRNLGLAHARGEFVGFLDADDLWLPEKLADQVAVLEGEPAASLIYGRTLIWHSWDAGADQADFCYELGVAPNRRYAPPLLFNLLIENRAQSPTTCNALMRRTLFDAVGGFEEAFAGMFEDQVFFAKALLQAEAYVDGRIWAKYRQHAASCAARSAAAGGDDSARLRSLLWISRNLGAALKRYGGAGAMLRREIRLSRLAVAKGYARRLAKRLLAR